MKAKRVYLVLAATLTAATIAATASIGITSAAFTDSRATRLGSGGAMGGSYNIAFIAGDGSEVPGNPTPYVLDTSAVGPITFDSLTTPVAMRVATTTAATGPVRLTLYNAYPGTRPPDPGGAGPGADPYDFALYSINVDGAVVASEMTAAAVNAAGIVIAGWSTNVTKTVTVQLSLPNAVGNLYVFNRSLVLGIRFDGATS